MAPEQVIGLRLEMDGERYVNRYRSGWHFNWGPGKTTGINNALVATKGYGPALVLFGKTEWQLLAKSEQA